mmetsp:Transcript_35124/g.95208  ORF Transcript_35124/g.95208 Transcript_35124/m.95208 type:complete len:81 (-) Transcript_35124:51-293(-)
MCALCSGVGHVVRAECQDDHAAPATVLGDPDAEATAAAAAEQRERGGLAERTSSTRGTCASGLWDLPSRTCQGCWASACS